MTVWRLRLRLCKPLARKMTRPDLDLASSSSWISA